MKVLIVEDEQSAITLIKKILATAEQRLELVGEARNIEDAKRLILELRPDLLLLDIELQEGNGFQLLEELGNINLKVVFVTAHKQFALQAIKISALDYIVKPIDPDELLNAVNRARNEFEKESDHIRVRTLLKNQYEIDKLNHKIILRDKNGFQLLHIQDIIRLEALGSYTQFIVKERSPILVSKVLREYEELLTAHGFFRCHKTHLINTNYLQSYSRQEGDMLILKDKTKVPLANRKKDQIIKFLSRQTGTQ